MRRPKQPIDLNKEEEIDSPYPLDEHMLEEEGTEGSTDESNDPQFEEMPHLARGGMLDDDFSLGDPYSVDGGASSTVKGLPMPPPMAPPAPLPPAAPPMAPKAPPKVAPSPALPRNPLPGMPPDVTAEELEGYLGKQRSQINKYSPDRQYELEQSLMKQRRGPGALIGEGMANFADAVMQGVSRAGSLGAGDRERARQDQIFNDSVGAIDRAREGTMKQVSANEQIDFMDPSSTMSRLYQKTFAPIFTKMGYKPQDVANMPASQIQSLATLGIQYEDAQSQQELKRAMLGLQGDTAKANALNQMEQRRQDAAKGRVDAAKDILKNSGNARFLGVPIPFTSDVSGEDKEKALQVIREQMDGGSVHPQAAAAEAWAAANPDDPRSAEILRRLGK